MQNVRACKNFIFEIWIYFRSSRSGSELSNLPDLDLGMIEWKNTQMKIAKTEEDVGNEIELEKYYSIVESPIFYGIFS
jgi:hypothetical protein